MPELPKNRNEVKNIYDSGKPDTKEYYENLLSQFKSQLEDVDTSKLSEEVRDTKTTVLESQKEYIWIRIFTREEIEEIEVGDELTLHYIPTDEKINITFGAYEKLGLNRDHDDEVINYVSEEDKKILCCMVDLDRLNKNSSDIPTVRTFFRSSRYYYPNLFKFDEIKINCDKKDINIDYYNINF